MNKQSLFCDFYCTLRMLWLSGITAPAMLHSIFTTCPFMQQLMEWYSVCACDPTTITTRHLVLCRLVYLVGGVICENLVLCYSFTVYSAVIMPIGFLFFSHCIVSESGQSQRHECWKKTHHTQRYPAEELIKYQVTVCSKYNIFWAVKHYYNEPHCYFLLPKLVVNSNCLYFIWHIHWPWHCPTRNSSVPAAAGDGI